MKRLESEAMSEYDFQVRIDALSWNAVDSRRHDELECCCTSESAACVKFGTWHKYKNEQCMYCWTKPLHCRRKERKCTLTEEYYHVYSIILCPKSGYPLWRRHDELECCCTSQVNRCTACMSERLSSALRQVHYVIVSPAPQSHRHVQCMYLYMYVHTHNHDVIAQSLHVQVPTPYGP